MCNDWQTSNADILEEFEVCPRLVQTNCTTPTGGTPLSSPPLNVPTTATTLPKLTEIYHNWYILIGPNSPLVRHLAVTVFIGALDHSVVQLERNVSQWTVQSLLMYSRVTLNHARHGVPLELPRLNITPYNIEEFSRGTSKRKLINLKNGQVGNFVQNHVV